jgi:beta-1,4-mannosyl-glycoprotein beta-1,4-N-acetylglucosaminyltransferase
MIYDCFTFFNELDLLEIRLNILNDYVDKFVLVEATKTHQGKDKPLYFEQNKHRYKKFLDKIIHIVVDDMPEYNGNNSWELEHFQRNCITRGLKECKEEDIILISDIDEIPNPPKILENKNLEGIKIFRQKMFYYFLNCINASNGNRFRWNGTIMINYADLKIPQELREISMKMSCLFHSKIVHKIYWHLWKLINLDLKGIKLIFIEDGGWHFSYLGGVEMIIKKLESFAHTEYNKETFKDAKSIENAINNGKDIFGRNFIYKFIPLDNTFPEYILSNQNLYLHLIKN